MKTAWMFAFLVLLGIIGEQINAHYLKMPPLDYNIAEAIGVIIGRLSNYFRYRRIHQSGI